MTLKRQIRKSILEKRREFDDFKYLAKNEVIYKKVVKLLDILNAKNNTDKKVNFTQTDVEKLDVRSSLGIYFPLKSEPDLFKLAITFGKSVCIPKLKHNEMDYVLYQLGCQLVKSDFGNVLEPANGKVVIPKIVLVPGLAFDIKGHRLGFGVGHYDRYFAKKNHQSIIKIGVCYDEMLLEELPHDIHDVKMDYIVTETHIYKL